MTRQGYLKWKDTDVFKHWANGGDVQMKTINDGWVDVSPVITWYESADYRIKPLNKWEGTQVYEHWKNGGKTEYRGIHKWIGVENPVWYDTGSYRPTPGHWIRTEPPKDRWILRELKGSSATVHVRYNSYYDVNKWLAPLKNYSEIELTPNKWAEILKDSGRD